MRNIVTGLDIGTAAIRVVVVEWKRGSNTPQVLAMVKKNSRGIRRGYVVHQDEAAECISEALREAEKATKLRIKQAFIGLSGITLGSRVVDGSTAVARGDMEIGDLDIERAMDAAQALIPDIANNEVIHRFPISFKLDGRKVAGRPEGMKGNKLEVRAMFITYGSQHLKESIYIYFIGKQPPSASLKRAYPSRCKSSRLAPPTLPKTLRLASASLSRRPSK